MGPRRNAALIKLQQSIDELGPPLMLDGKSYKSTYDFRTFGFMVVKDFVDKSLIHSARLESMKQRFLDHPKIRNISNNKGSRRRSEGIGQRLQIITKTKDAEDHEALRYFSRAQKNLFNACREKITQHAQMLLDTDEDIDLVETILLSLDNSTVRQTPHPDLEPTYNSKAVLAFVSLEDHTTLVIYPRSHDWKENPDYRRIGRRYGIFAGDALFFHPSCIHAGDSYVNSNIRLHYYAFKAGTEWKEDSAYSVPTPTARMLTHDPKVAANTLKRSLCAREKYERAVEAKRLKDERTTEYLMQEMGIQKVFKDILHEFYEFVHAQLLIIATDCLEATYEKLASGQPHSL
jgi:ectoine hydroxylase-related dioxygenase (phytanoyl-CoA dioxygenase family)